MRLGAVIILAVLTTQGAIHHTAPKPDKKLNWMTPEFMDYMRKHQNDPKGYCDLKVSKC